MMIMMMHLDTIQILKRLDLAITCDTSLAHLADSLRII